MQALDKQRTLAVLRGRIAGIVDLSAATPADHAPRPAASHPLALPGGRLHEVFTDERRNAGAALGFALGLARDLLGPARPAAIYLQLNRDAQEMGLPYGAGLASFGFDPDTLLLVRANTIVELLWAAEEALACRAVAAVIADVAGRPKSLDFTVSRRLSLRAAKDGASFFWVRYGHWRAATAAQYRWRLQPVRSAETPFDARAPGHPNWLARLEKGAVGNSRQNEWFLGWTHHGFNWTADRPRPADRSDDAAALSHAVSIQLGDRLSQTA